MLIHCLVGRSRSAAVAIGYVMWNLQLHFKEAFALVKTAHPSTNPNIGFLAQLKQYQRSLVTSTQFPDDPVNSYCCTKCSAQIFYGEDIEHACDASQDGVWITQPEWLEVWETAGCRGDMHCPSCQSTIGLYTRAGAACVCGWSCKPSYFLLLPSYKLSN